MEDAYEIGIRLVLENGVSAGIASLQDELAAYDRALAATTGRVSPVVNAANKLKTPVSPDLARSLTTGFATVEKSGATNSDEKRILKAPTQAKMTPLSTVAGQPARATPTPLTPRAVMVEVTANRPTAPLRMPMAPEVPGRASVVEFPDSKLQTRVPATVPTVTVSPSRFAYYAPASPAGQAPIEVPPTELVTGPNSISLTKESSGQQKSQATRELPFSSDWDGPPPTAVPAPMSVQAPVRPAPAAQALTTPAAPVAATSSSTPMQGDVYLDGARVGRWMSDQLAREADGPQAGITGFDPRLGPAWPGSLHGT